MSTVTAAPSATVRRLSGFKPTGRLHLGNYLGAIRPMLDAAAARPDTAATADRTAVTTPLRLGKPAPEMIIMIANLHALTVEHDPQRLRALTDELLATLLACGIDPDTTLTYVQSDVPEHAGLHYLLECATGYGEAARMIQFRTKSAGPTRSALSGSQASPEQVRLSLLTYPVLMAADILLHDTDEVPVGEDQTQHLELARDVANRFNTRYGPTFAVPRGVNPPVASRVMDLADPKAKMGKSSLVDSGTIHLLDKPELVRRKVARAVTDTDGAVTYHPERKPGLSNLLEILAACERDDPAVTALRFTSYAEVKEAVVESIVDTLAPVQRRYAQVVADRAYLDEVRRAGAARARDRAGQTLARATQAIGLAT